MMSEQIVVDWLQLIENDVKKKKDFCKYITHTKISVKNLHVILSGVR